MSMAQGTLTNRDLREAKRAQRRDRKRGGGEGGELSQVWRMLAPWLLLGTAVAGAPLAWLLAWWGQVQAFTAVCLAVAGVVMVAVSLHLTRGRMNLGRWHELFNFAAPVAVIAWTIAYGIDKYVLIGSGIFGATSAIIWNRRHTSTTMREMERLAGGRGAAYGNIPAAWREFTAEHMDQLKESTMIVFKDTPDMFAAGIDLGEGETPGDLTKTGMIDKIGRFAGGIAGGTTLAIGDYLDRVGVTVMRTDPLKNPFVWQGPTAPGQSIIEPIEGLGRYRDGVDLGLLLPHVAAKTEDGEDKQHSHMAMIGMSRAGKGAAGEMIDTCVMTRRDAAVVLCDSVKADQQLGGVGKGAVYVLDNAPKIRSFFHKIVHNSIPWRAAYLGDPRRNQLGKICKEWEPGCGLTWILVHAYEAAALFNNADMTMITERAASVGIQLIVEAQIAKHNKVDTNLRSNMGDLLMFGCYDYDDAALVMPADLLDMGASPWVWRNRKPGMVYTALGHLPLARQVMPARFARPARDGSDIEAALTEYMHLVDPLDPITAASWGEPYALFAAQRQAAADRAPKQHAFRSGGPVLAGAVMLDQRPAPAPEPEPEPAAPAPPAAVRYSEPRPPAAARADTGFDLGDDESEDDEVSPEQERDELVHVAEGLIGDMVNAVEGQGEAHAVLDQAIDGLERYGHDDGDGPDEGGPFHFDVDDIDFPDDPDEAHLQPLANRDEALDVVLDILHTIIGEGNTFGWIDLYDEVKRRTRRGESWVRRCRPVLMGWGCIQETDQYGVFVVIHTSRGDLDDYPESPDE